MRRAPTRRAVLGALPPLLLGAGRGRAAEPRRIAMLLWRGETEVEAGFRASLAERGLAAEIEVHDVARDSAAIPDAVAAIRAARPDLVYTWGTTLALATVGRDGQADPARQITDRPVLSTMVASPSDVGLVPPDGLSRRNVTAVSHVAPVATQVQAILAFRPIRRLGVIHNPAEPNSVANVARLGQECAAAGLELQALAVPAGADGEPDPGVLPGFLDDLAAGGAEFLYIGPDSFVGAHGVEITRGALDRGIPSFTGTELEVREAFALFGLVSRYRAVGALTARQAGLILAEGRDPGTLPTARLDRFAIVLRRDAMAELGLYPPMDILRYAEVIE